MPFFLIGLSSAFVFVLCLLWAISQIHKDKEWVLPGILAALSFTALVYALLCLI